MPSASYGPAHRIANLGEGVALLRARGLRLSASRRALLEALLAAEGPASAERLAGGHGGRGRVCDLPSTYRNLELFERLGLVRHVHIGHGPGLYALAGEGNRTYLVCERCGELSRLPAAREERIRAEIARASGFQAHFSHFPILGLCASCAEDGDGGGHHRGGAMHHGGPDEHEHGHD